MATAATPDAKGPARLPRAARREAILQGAANAFAHGGFAATSMADVAAASGVTQLILYRHFGSKEELYRAVLERVFDRLAPALRSPDPADFGVTPRSVLASAREDPAGFRVLWRHAAREPQFAHYASDLCEQAVGASEAALADRVAPDTLEWAARAAVGYVVEAVLSWLEHGDPARDERFLTATNAAMRAGVRAWSRAS